MDLKLILMAVVFDIALAHTLQNEDTFYIPIVKMHDRHDSERSPGDNYITKEYLDKRLRQVFVNITTALVDDVQKSENVTSASTGSKYATLEDLERIASELLVDISSILSGQGQAHGSERKEQIKPRDCNDVQNRGHDVTGIYTIYPDSNSTGISVRCDMDTSTGGWTVIQRRVSDSDFYKTWDEYKTGFGNLSTNFWLGNDNIHTISFQCRYELRVDLVSSNGEMAYAQYREFGVGDAESGYKLVVAGYSGNAGDSLIRGDNGNGMKFSTYDRDNDIDNRNCAVVFHGAWWYRGCHYSNLNGDYGSTKYAEGPVWEFMEGILCTNENDGDENSAHSIIQFKRSISSEGLGENIKNNYGNDFCQV